MNLTKKQIKRICMMTKKELIGTQPSIKMVLGYFQPSGANWSYVAGWTYEGDLVVTQFGSVKG